MQNPPDRNTKILLPSSLRGELVVIREMEREYSGGCDSKKVASRDSFQRQTWWQRGACCPVSTLSHTLCPQGPRFISGGRLVKLPVLQERGFPAFVVPEVGSWDGVDATLQCPVCSGAFCMPPSATDLAFSSSSQCPPSPVPPSTWGDVRGDFCELLVRRTDRHALSRVS